MGRAGNNNEGAGIAVEPRPASASERKEILTMSDLILDFSGPSDPDWKLPPEIERHRGQAFVSPEHRADGGLDLDPLIGFSLSNNLPFESNGDLAAWYDPAPVMFTVTAVRSEQHDHGEAPLIVERQKGIYRSEAEAEAAATELVERFQAQLPELQEKAAALRNHYEQNKDSMTEAQSAKLLGEVELLERKAARAERCAVTCRIDRREIVTLPEATCPGMTEAAKTLSAAIDSGEKIAVFCDYDVDGTTSGEIIRRTLDRYGADTLFEYADASQGFGLTDEFVKKASAEGAKLLVTLDCGSTQVRQIELAQSLGMKVIVVDHHHAASNSAEHHLNPKLYAKQEEMHGFGELIENEAMREATRTYRIDESGEVIYEPGIGGHAEVCSFTITTENIPKMLEVVNEWARKKTNANSPAEIGDRDYKHYWYKEPSRNIWVSERQISPERLARIEEEAKKLGPFTFQKRDYVERGASANTGAQLSWKLAAALELERDGEIQPEHYQEAMYYAGMGCHADMGSPNLIENRCFLWHPSKSVPLPIRRLAERMGENPEHPGTMVATQAILNLPKRTPKVKASDVGRFLAMTDEQEIADWVENANSFYENAKEIRKEIVAKAVEQTGQSSTDPVTGKMIRPDADDQFFAVFKVDGYEDYVGYNGPVTNKVSGLAKKPAIGLTRRGVEEITLPDGSVVKQEIWKGRICSDDDVRALESPEKDPFRARNTPPSPSIMGILSELSPDPEVEGWLQGELTLDNGDTREIRFPADSEDTPVGERVEWLLRRGIGNDGPYWLRTFHRG